MNKFVPALNEVAFPAYARLGENRSEIAWSFAKAVRLVMLVAIPFSLGFAIAARPLVETVLDPPWLEAAPIVRLLGFAMPFVTLQILFAPATNALGRPGIAAMAAAAGALLMPAAFLIGVRGGPVGVAVAWLCAFPLLTLLTAALSLPVIGLPGIRLLAALLPSLGAGMVMAGVVTVLDALLPSMAAPVRLLSLTGAGCAVYGGALLLFAQPVLREALSLLRGRRPIPA